MATEQTPVPGARRHGTWDGRAKAPRPRCRTFDSAIDDGYYRNGGVLQTVLRPAGEAELSTSLHA